MLSMIKPLRVLSLMINMIYINMIIEQCLHCLACNRALMNIIIKCTARTLILYYGVAITFVVAVAHDPIAANRDWAAVWYPNSSNFSSMPIRASRWASSFCA